MKTKKFHKRLTLNKKTIADLNNGMMGNVHGGISLYCTHETCPTNWRNCTLLTYCDTCPSCPTQDTICN